MKASVLPVLQLSGPPRERGREHGETLREMIHEHRVRWEAAMADDTGLTPDDYLDRLFSRTQFMPAILRHTPNLLDEVEGIAEGADIDRRYLLARQLSDEEPWFRRTLKAESNNAEGCSSLGQSASAAKPALVAQNMDCPLWYDGHQLLLVQRGPDLPHTIYGFTLVGKVSLCGVNSAGMAIMCNTLAQLDYSQRGLPEDYVVRGFLQQPDLACGLRFLNKIEHASGQNYSIGAPGEAVLNLEASARSVVRYQPFANRVFHTNHPLKNPDTQIHDRSVAQASDAERVRAASRGTSVKRFMGLEREMKGIDVLDLSKAKELLSMHDCGVCRHGDDIENSNRTIGCVIAELTEPPRLHVAPGPPCSTPFTTLVCEP